MTKKKSLRDVIDQAKERLPSSRSSKLCVGCFSPRNTLTVKPHTNQIFNANQIELDEEREVAKANCLYCGEKRILSMSSFSFDVLKADYPEFEYFLLTKDHKDKCDKKTGCRCYTSVVGISEEFVTSDLIDELQLIRKEISNKFTEEMA